MASDGVAVLRFTTTDLQSYSAPTQVTLPNQSKYMYKTQSECLSR